MAGEHARRHDEHARVPQVALRHVAGGGVGVRLLHELGDPAGAALSVGFPGAVGEGRTGRDVPVGGRGLGGRQADRHNVAVAGGTNRGLDSGTQQLGAGNQMVGRKGPDNRIVPKALTHDVGGEADRRHGIASRRLDEERAALRGSELGQLGEHAVAVRLAGHDTHRRGRLLQAVHCALQEGAARARQVEEELGTATPRQRPQAGAGTAGGDDHVEVTHAPQYRRYDEGARHQPRPLVESVCYASVTRQQPLRRPLQRPLRSLPQPLQRRVPERRR